MFWQSIKVKFSVIMLLAILGTLLVSYLSFQRIIEDIEFGIGGLFAEKQVLYDRERSLRPILRELALAKKLVGSPAIISWAEEPSNSKLKNQGLSLLENYKQEFLGHTYFIAFKKTGEYYYNDAENQYTGQELRNHLEKDNPENLWFFKTMAQGDPCLFNVDYDEVLKVTKVWVNCVIRNKNQPLGVVGTGIDLTTFIAKVINDSQPGISNLFMDSTGAIQTHKDAKQIDFRSISKRQNEKKTIFNLVDSPEERTELKEAMQILRSGKKDVATMTLHIERKRYMAGLAYIKEIDWYDLTLMETGSWSTEQFFNPLALLLIFCLIIWAVISGLLFKIIALDRIARLEKGTKNIGKGHYEVQLLDDSRDEIGRLNRSFRLMADQIQKHTQDLEKKVAERTLELEEAIKSKDRLFAILAHDLRGPVGNLAKFFQGDFTCDDLAQPEVMTALKSSTQGTYDLLETLLLWVRSQREGFEFSTETLSVNQLIDKIICLFEIPVNEKQLRWNLGIKENLLVQGNGPMVESILRNLLNNAIKFSRNNAEIAISAQEDQGMVLFSIKDHGVGMSAETLSTLFEVDKPRVKNLELTEDKGAGLGLILCQEFIQLHGGIIRAESEQGKGSRFIFTLPVANPTR